MSPDDTKSLIDGTIVSGAPGSINATKMRTVLKAVVDAIVAAVASKADLDSAVFTDMVEVPTAAPGTNNNTAASTAFVATAVAGAASALSTHTSNVSNPHSVTKSQVGLGSVDNTADTAKPVSTAQATADGIRVLKAGDTMTGALTLPGNPVNPLEAAPKQYVDQIIASQDAMVFKGLIDCSTDPNYPAADRGWPFFFDMPATK
jgi:hypothetical protein